MIGYRVAFALALGISLAGCGGGSSGSGNTAGGVVPLDQVRQLQAQALVAGPKSSTPSQQLYVQTLDDVYVYALGASTPSATIPNVNRGAVEGTVAVNPVNGQLYVAELKKERVARYTANGKKLLGTITGIVSTQFLTFDSLGNCYVDDTGSAAYIGVFPPNSSTPSYTISTAPLGVAYLSVDGANNLYAVFGSGYEVQAINVYAQGSSTPTYSITSGFSSLWVDAMTVDNAGNIYVSNGDPGGSGSVVVYQHGSTTPSYTITNGINGPYTLAVDANGNLYVGNFQQSPSATVSSVSVYAPGATTPSYTINENGADPASFAFTSNQNLYVGEFDSGVSEYAYGSGNPLGSTAISNLQWIAIGE
jgi:hypothetical protein